MTQEKSVEKHPKPFINVSEAFLTNRHFLKNFLRRFLCSRQDIEDVMQEAFLKAYGAEKAKPIEQPKSFIFRIAKNLALNELKRKSRQVTGYIEESDSVHGALRHDGVESELEAQQSLGVYCEAIASLPSQCRRVYLLRKVDGLHHTEIAERLNISVSAVEKHLAKGVLKCQAYVRDKPAASSRLRREASK